MNLHQMNLHQMNLNKMAVNHPQLSSNIVKFISNNYALNDGGLGDTQGPGDGAGIPGSGEADENDDGGIPIPLPHPMPDDLEKPPYARKEKSPHEEKSIDQT